MNKHRHSIMKSIRDTEENQTFIYTYKYDLVMSDVIQNNQIVN